MAIEVSTEVLVSVTVPLLGVIFGLYGRSLSAENLALRNEVANLKIQHKEDVKRLEDGTTTIWNEIKCQRSEIAETREVVMKLNSSIDRLNEILPTLREAIGSKVSTEMCHAIRQSHVELRANNRI